MQKITYVKEQYSQIKLYDGSRIFVETLPEMIRVRKMILGIIPTKTIWQFRFPFYIRTVGEAWELAKEILDLVINSIDDCKKIGELEQKLRNKTTPLLNNYVQNNEERAYQIGIEKLGSFAAKKYIKSSPKLKDALTIPRDAMDIIGDYGKVLEDLSGESNNFFHPISKLPYSKEKIERALDTALKVSEDEKIIKHLKVARTALKTFIPDDEVEKANQNLLKDLEDVIEKKDKRR